MSLAESFFSTAKDLLLATENIKRLEQKIDTIARDLSSMEHRLVRIEIYTEMARPQSASRTLDVPKPRKPSTKKS